MKRARGWLAKTLLVVGAGACGITERTVKELDPSAGQGGSQHSGAGRGMATAGVVGVTTGGATSATGGAGPVIAGFGTGGKALPGGAPNATCEAQFLSYEPTCAAPPDADPSWCVPSMAGASGEAPGPLFDLVDDLEDGDAVTRFVLGGRGAWFFSNDGSGQQFPAPCMVPSLLREATQQNLYGMRTYGAFFSTLPGGFSNIGVALRSGDNGCTEPIDASDHGAIRFLMHGAPGFVRFSVATVATSPTTNQGTCLQQCWDAHGIVLQLHERPVEYIVAFSELFQEGWGTPAGFDRSQILGMQWSAKADSTGALPAGCFDFWIDDVLFD